MKYKVTIWDRNTYQVGNNYEVQAAGRFDAAQQVINLVEVGNQRQRYTQRPVIWEIEVI